MSDLKRYEVEIPGRGGIRRTTLLLSDEDAKKQGLTQPAGKAAPANKAAAPRANKASTPRAKKPATPKPAPAAETPAAAPAAPETPAAE